jgi:serine/threonine protein kinase/tetratricopeptide (TPR) repeat protein
LFETGLDLLAHASAVDSTPVGQNHRVPLDGNKGTRQTKMFGNFGDYELLEEVGRGGQGVVFRAHQKSLNRTVALKIIGLGQWAADAHLKRFRLEAEAAASLEHPGIVPIYEVAEREGSCYFSMKFIEGGQLDAVLKRQPITIRKAVELIAKVARTVHYAHEHGILHRDIKPGNILLDAKGEPHLTDFGLARLVESDSSVTQTKDVLGTPSYMAPEQAVGNNSVLSSATDVYSLGAVLYQLLTSHPPFAGGTTYETIKLLLDNEPRPPRTLNPKIDRDLSTICLKCLEKDPQRRYSSALALTEDLERWLRHEPILARHIGIASRSKKWVQRNPTRALLAASLVALAAAAGWIISKTDFRQHPVTTGLAVLPFENLSDEKDQAFFADGVQDDILIKLAKIAELKVISRSSVMQFRGKQDVRLIANALGVSHVLEGTVRRAAGKLHVNAQLVDARTDQDIWAEEYDRDLKDVFAIETAVAQSIASRLRTKVTAREKAAMQERPTMDLVAYDLYAQASSLIDNATYKERKKQGDHYFQATELLNRAIARDSSFFLAYCRLAQANDEYYYMGFDRKPARLDLAKSAIDSAFRLKPDSGDAHLALGRHFYHGYLDYDRARDELASAARSLPNDPRIFEWLGYIDRRQSRWNDALRDFERAMELDPRNINILAATAITYHLTRDYKRERQIVDRLIALDPDNLGYRLGRPHLDINERADTRTTHAALETIAPDTPESAGMRLELALYDRDPGAADRAMAGLRAHGLESFEPGRGGMRFTIALQEGLVARMKGDSAGARVAFTAARVKQEQILRTRPDYGPFLVVVGLVDAGLGRNEEAMREGRQALELTSATHDSFDIVDVRYVYAQICAWTGDSRSALEQLEMLAKMPAGPSYGELRLNPIWDPLRGDPAFEKIVQSLARK